MTTPKTADGNARLFSDAMAVVKDALPEMDPSAMAWQFPPMTAIDKEDPAAAFTGLRRSE